MHLSLLVVVKSRFWEQGNREDQSPKAPVAMLLLPVVGQVV